jgi:hypothetical protein
VRAMVCFSSAVRHAVERDERVVYFSGRATKLAHNRFNRRKRKHIDKL